MASPFSFPCAFTRRLSAAVLLIALFITAKAELRSQSFFASLAEKGEQGSGFNAMERAFLEWSRQVPLDSAWGWKWYRRWEWFTARRAYTDGSFPDARLYLREAEAVAERKEEEKGAHGIQGAGQRWTPVGPAAIPPGDDPLKTHGLGRINCVTFHPDDPNTMWVGVAQGGVWKTVNGGQSWRPLTDNLPILRISDIAADPVNTDVLYISVGDYAYLGTSLSTDQRKRHTHYGMGVYKTTDGGESWFATGLSFAQKDFDGSLIRRVFVHPENPARLLAAGTSGIWKSEDAGATWRRTDERFIWDIERSGADPDLLCASTGYSDDLGIGEAGIISSTDFGETWIDASADIPPTGEVERIEIAFSSLLPDQVYAVASAVDQGFHSFYYSDNGGRSWTVRADRSTAPNILGRSTGLQDQQDETGGQGSYDLAILADPKDGDRVYVGGINLWGSTDAGLTWDIVQYGTNDWGPGLHPDQHFLAYNRLNGRYFICNDGGIYTTDTIIPGNWKAALENPGYRWPTRWQSLNDGLAVTSFYHLGLGASGTDEVVAGAQDNSTYYREGDEWINIFNGDGMDCLIDPANPDIIYGSSQFGVIVRRDRRSGISGEILSYPILTAGDEIGEWSTPFRLHPANSNLLYAAFGNVWVRDNGTDSWQRISGFPAMPGYPFSSPASAFALAPSRPERMYVAKRPWHFLDIRAQVYTTENGGANWTEITAGLPDTLFITSITVDDADPERAWISCAGFAEGLKVFRTTDGGNTWQNVSRNLPNLPANIVLHDPASPRNTLYVGMDVGVYYTNDDMEGWEPYIDGLPNVIVSDLAIDPAAGKLAASTFGRGIWETETVDRLQSAPRDGGKEEAIARLHTNRGDGSFTLELDGWSATNNATVTLLDITGRRILADRLPVTGGSARREYRPDLPYGLYFITVDDGRERRALRFVVEK